MKASKNSRASSRVSAKKNTNGTVSISGNSSEHHHVCPFHGSNKLETRGYSGDSEMMRMIYANEYAGDSTFAKILNKHPLDHPGSKLFGTDGHSFQKCSPKSKNRCRNHADGRCRVLSVACGPAFELKDLLSSPEDFDIFHFTLLDQDKYALFEAAVLVDQIEKTLDRKIGVNYLNESVRTMLATRNLEGQWVGSILSIQWTFRLPHPPVAAAVLRKLYELLSPGGEM